jgi:invasion protein IalB
MVRPPAESETPQSTAATYGDWVVQCQMQSGTPPKKICEMAQVTEVQGKNLPFSRVMIVEPGKGEPLKLVVQVPVNVSFAAKVRVQTSASDSGMAAPFARCASIGCFADFEINEDVLRKLRAATGPGKLTFADAGGRDVAIPMSFKGFSAALDALMRG